MHALCVNPDLDSRMRFKQMALTLNHFKSVHLAGSLGEGLERLRTNGSCNAVYLSSRFEERTVAEFVKTSRTTEQAQDAAMLLIFSSHAEQAERIATFSIHGVDGFLFEPFSPDTLQTTTDLVRRVNGERAKTRLRTAVDILIPRIIDEVDRAADQRRLKPSAERSKALQTLGASLRALPEEARTHYYESLIERTGELLPPKVTERLYQGASMRLRKKMVKVRV